MKIKINLTEYPSVMMLYLTLGCNARCAHCAYECDSKKLHLKITPDEVVLAIQAAKKNGIGAMGLSGGEPFLLLDLVELSLKEARQAGLYPFIATNAFWASTPQKARDILTDLAKLGLNHIQVSYDHYHAKFIQPNCVINACEQAEQLGYRIQLGISEANGHIKQQTIDSLRSLQRFADDETTYSRNLVTPQSVGRGVNLSGEELVMDELVLLRCVHFEHHYSLVSVFPSHLVLFCCSCTNPRLTYEYPVKENWLADMLDVWDNDECIKAMWHQSLAQLSPSHKLRAEQPCGYCFELLPALYPDKELIDIRALK